MESVETGVTELTGSYDLNFFKANNFKKSFENWNYNLPRDSPNLGLKNNEFVVSSGGLCICVCGILWNKFLIMISECFWLVGRCFWHSWLSIQFTDNQIVTAHRARWSRWQDNDDDGDHHHHYLSGAWGWTILKGCWLNRERGKMRRRLSVYKRSGGPDM